ncbi:MAG: hypothetical protein ACLRWL_01480 [Evtepia gabavorous]
MRQAKFFSSCLYSVTLCHGRGLTFCGNLIISRKKPKSTQKYLDKLLYLVYTESNLKRYEGDTVIKTDELRGIIAKNNLSQAKVAEEIGITPKTFYEKMNKGVFGSDEIEVMIHLLKIENPVDIFFAKE